MGLVKKEEGGVILVASLLLPPARQLAEVGRRQGRVVHALDEEPGVRVEGRRTFYGGTDRAGEYAARFELCLIEPPLDLLARVPADLLGRAVRFGTLEGLARVEGPVFVKPADPIAKVFDAGVYRSVGEVRGRRPIAGGTEVLVSDAVEWTSEYRCFVREGKLEAWSPYLSFGRPVWKPESAGETPSSLTAFCGRLVERMGRSLPPALVVDVGILEDGRWAVVEFNPAWCSGILGAKVEAVLRVVERAAMWVKEATGEDRGWVKRRRMNMRI